MTITAVAEIINKTKDEDMDRFDSNSNAAILNKIVLVLFTSLCIWGLVEDAVSVINIVVSCCLRLLFYY